MGSFCHARPFPFPIPPPYTSTMLRYFQILSAILFYLLGSSVFAAYLLHGNDIMAEGALQWMLSVMLPLLVCGLLYGGLSIYASVRGSSGKSAVFATVLAAVSLFVFSAFAVLTFWPK